jgi:tetratricopeptide (TPR) repeat protein
LVNRFTPDLGQALRAEELAGVTISKPVIAIYETQVLRQAMIDLCRQAIAAADPWAAAMKAGGVLNPDPRTARAAGYLCLGDTLVAAGRIDEAVAAYQTMVDIFPGWVGGYLSLAETHERRGDLPAAVVAYKQAVAYNPAWQSALADEAVALVNQGEYEAALDIYHRLVGNE